MVWLKSAQAHAEILKSADSVEFEPGSPRIRFRGSPNSCRRTGRRARHGIARRPDHGRHRNAIPHKHIGTRPRVGAQACGDAHLMNFGGFAAPEWNIVFDIKWSR